MDVATLFADDLTDLAFTHAAVCACCSHDSDHAPLTAAPLKVQSALPGSYIGIAGFPSQTLDADLDEIVDYLNVGYWSYATGGAWTDGVAWDVSSDNVLTFDVSALTNEGAALARAAFDTWAAVVDLVFVEQVGGADIVFDDDESGAFAFFSELTQAPGGEAHIIERAAVNVSTAWLNTYGTETDSFSFHTYVHEIGHALGLGHAGPYNGAGAAFSSETTFSLDSWQVTVMSYFSQSEAGVGSYSILQGPMLADMLALGELYGAAEHATADTTYGFGATEAGSVYDADTNRDGQAYLIHDTGGIDTLDYSGYGADQAIDLRAGAVSNVGGGTGNVVLSPDTVIERVFTGSGDDVIRATVATTFVDGGAGRDLLDLSAGAGPLTVDVSAGTYTAPLQIERIEGFVGTVFADTLRGDDGENIFEGGDGADILEGRGGRDTLRHVGDAGGVVVDLQANAAIDGWGNTDTISSFENVFGSRFDDTLSGTGAKNQIIGVGGADTIDARGGDDLVVVSAIGILVDGGGGFDTLAIDARFENGVTIDLRGAFATVGTGPVRDFEALASVIGSPGDDTIHIGDAVVYDRSNTQLETLGFGTLDGVSYAGEITGGAGNDLIVGGAADDTIVGGIGNDRIEGGDGNDTLFSYGFGQAGLTDNDEVYGGNGDDFIQVADGNDVAFGEGGDDVLSAFGGSFGDRFFLHGGAGNDIINGSAVGDFLFGDEGDDDLFGDAGNDQLFGGLGDDVLNGAEGIDQVFGEAGNDQVAGGFGDDWLDGGDGDDTLTGGRGDDQLDGGSGADSLAGNNGDDQLAGGGGDDTLIGGSGADTLYGGSGDDMVEGGDGNDDGNGGQGDDVFFGGEGADTFGGASGNDRLYGEAGDDTLNGAIGDDILFGANGDDQLVLGDGRDRGVGGAGNDNITGADGDDLLEGGGGVDSLFGGDGADTLKGGRDNDSLFAGAGDDLAYGGSGNDALFGQAGDDTLFGQGGDDQLNGAQGADLLDGGLGNDTLNGGSGDDWLIGGSGDDVLRGQGGSDTFVFDGQDSGSDTVIDFQAGEQIHLNRFGYASADAAFADFRQAGDDVLFQSDGTEIIFQDAALSDVLESITVDTLLI